jgi:hypothetical protein
LQDLEARMKELGQKFLITDVKLLHDALSDHALQSRFDVQARKSLEKWEKLVRYALSSRWGQKLIRLRTQLHTEPLATRKVHGKT